jgi:DNA replication protein DnaC
LFLKFTPLYGHNFEKQWLTPHLVIIDELGYVPFSKVGAELLFQFCSSRYERGSMIITTNLEFPKWTEVLGVEQMTAALLDRLTHNAHILNINGESYRFKQALSRKTGYSRQFRPAFLYHPAKHSRNIRTPFLRHPATIIV